MANVTSLRGSIIKIKQPKMTMKPVRFWKPDKFSAFHLVAKRKFDTYRFADYKEQVIDLLKRVCTVSVETMKIVEEM